MRGYGPFRGQESPAEAKSAAAPARKGQGAGGLRGKELVGQSGCLACHGYTNKIVGPGFNEIAGKYRGQDGAQAKLAAKVRNGGTGVWGSVPMPPQPQLKDDDIQAMVQWIAGGAQ